MLIAKRDGVEFPIDNRDSMLTDEDYTETDVPNWYYSEEKWTPEELERESQKFMDECGDELLV